MILVDIITIFILMAYIYVYDPFTNLVPSHSGKKILVEWQEMIFKNQVYIFSKIMN